MAKTNDSADRNIEQQKKELGKKIKECRAAKSLRSIANAVGLPPSNMKYIEDGVNAPSPEIYANIIDVLNPSPLLRTEMDRLYMAIRNAPPPDVCKVVIDNQNLNDSLRILSGHTLTPQQFQELNTLLYSFSENK